VPLVGRHEVRDKAVKSKKARKLTLLFTSQLVIVGTDKHIAHLA
jgi:hypothetical protein